MTDDNGANPPDGMTESDVAASDVADSTIPDDAFISPDEPIVRRETEAVPDDAFISPDDPFERSDEPMIGTVVGMDGSAAHSSSLASIHLDPEQVSQILEDTARRVRDEGVRAGLRANPDAPHFEVMLKAYLAGYFSNG
jgi:hypothetical protein